MMIIETKSRECCTPADIKPVKHCKMYGKFFKHGRCEFCKKDYILVPDGAIMIDALPKGWGYSPWQVGQPVPAEDTYKSLQDSFWWTDSYIFNSLSKEDPFYKFLLGTHKVTSTSSAPIPPIFYYHSWDNKFKTAYKFTQVQDSILIDANKDEECPF